MIDLELDHGARCDRHIGEAFRVRCTDCDDEAERAAAELAASTQRERPKDWNPPDPLRELTRRTHSARRSP